MALIEKKKQEPSPKENRKKKALYRPLRRLTFAFILLILWLYKSVYTIAFSECLFAKAGC
jgi:hypothetical protein